MEELMLRFSQECGLPERVRGAVQEEGTGGGQCPWCMRQTKELDPAVGVCSRCAPDKRIISDACEWGFDDSDAGNRVRCGLPFNALLPLSSMSTFIGGFSRNFELAAASKRQRWSSMPYKERALYRHLQRLDQCTSAANFTADIVDLAKRIYTSVIEVRPDARGSAKTGLLAASLHVACIQRGAPRSMTETATIMGIQDVGLVRKACKSVQQVVGCNVGPMGVSDVIPRLCNRLGIGAMSQDAIDLGTKLQARTKQADTASGGISCNPMMLAAIAIAMTTWRHGKGCGRLLLPGAIDDGTKHVTNVSMKDIANAAGVDETRLERAVRLMPSV